MRGLWSFGSSLYSSWFEHTIPRLKELASRAVRMLEDVNKTWPSSSITPRISPSPDLIDNIERHSILETPKTLTRSSSVRFADDTVGNEQMPRQSASHDSDEIVPIRIADSHSNRTYNTSETSRIMNSNNDGAASIESGRPQEIEKKPSWYKKIADKYGSVELDNKGSVARDHLALERTFLAWLRTSLAFASIGVAVTQLFRLNTSIQTKQPNASFTSSALPLSPMLGHGLPVELVPILQQLASATAQALPMPTNTLMDQILLMSLPPAHEQEFDQGSATRLRRVGKPLGATFIGISIIVLLVGFHRYFEAQYWIIRGKFPASRGSIAFVGAIAGALIIASLIVVLVIAPTSYEKKWSTSQCLLQSYDPQQRLQHLYSYQFHKDGSKRTSQHNISLSAKLRAWAWAVVLVYWNCRADPTGATQLVSNVIYSMIHQERFLRHVQQ